MRYRLLGDLLSIKSALLYKRGYVDVTKGRNPVGQMNSSRVSQGDFLSFMEYNFKFNIDKGPYSSYNIYNLIGNETLSKLSNKDDEISVPSDLLMYQLSDDQVRNYSFFEIFVSDSLTEILVNVGPDIQKIEFYDSVVNYKMVDGVIPNITEYYYSEEGLQASPVMIVEFGPEVSYESEDYYNKEEMDSKPDWDFESEKAYQLRLEEYTNNKLLLVTTVTADKSSGINVSLASHRSQLNPHRFQYDHVVSNLKMRDLMNTTGDTISVSGNITFDERSNSILSVESLDKNESIILNDKMNISSKLHPITIIKDGEEVTENHELYYDYVVYNKGSEVIYKGELYVSLIDGNLYENPSISPMWQLVSTIVEEPEVDTTDKVINIRVNDPFLGTTDPIGQMTVKYGHEAFIKIISERAFVKSIRLDGIDQPLPMGDVFTVREVKSDHDLFVEFEAIHKTITITVDPESSGVCTGENSYILNTPATLTATPSEGYKFVGWILDEKIVSTDEIYYIPKVSQDFHFIAKFSKIICKVVIECSEGGSFDLMNGNPTVIEVEYGDSLEFNILPKSGYEVDYISIDSVIYSDPELYIVLVDITKDTNVFIKFTRPKLREFDEELGEIEYSIIGNRMWSINDLAYDKLGKSRRYYNGSDMMTIDNLLSKGGTGFRIPTINDVHQLYNIFDEKLTGESLKSKSIYRLATNELDGWYNSIFRGRNLYKFNSMPYGSYSMIDEEFRLSGLNTESWYWTSSVNNEDSSSAALNFLNDSPSGFLINRKLSESYLCIRLVKDTPTVEILGKSYRYISISVKVKVRVLDDDNVVNNDKFEEHLIRQDWFLDNLDYTELGTRFESTETDKFGSLYSLADVLAIKKLLADSEFNVPTDLDYIFLERYLGYSNDEIVKRMDGTIAVNLDTYNTGYIGTTEGKRMKTGDMIYSGINWNGYSSSNTENSQLNILPSGYARVTVDGVKFVGMGSDAKFWTSTLPDEESNIAYSRSLSSDSDKILRGSEQGNRIMMSVRLVRTTDTLIE